MWLYMTANAKMTNIAGPNGQRRRPKRPTTVTEMGVSRVRRQTAYVTADVDGRRSSAVVLNLFGSVTIKGFFKFYGTLKCQLPLLVDPRITVKEE